MSDFEKIVKAKGKCCITGKPLNDCQAVNMVQLQQEATWDYPVWGNVLLRKPAKFALAVVHDCCVQDGCVIGTIKYAIEFINGELIYHELPAPRICRMCGCSEMDACYHPELGNCSWVEADLCSHCVEVPGKAIRYSQMKNLSSKK